MDTKKMAYLVKFLPEDVKPPFLEPKSATLKIGTFKHYRNIEDETRRDREEGQRGLDLTVRKTSKRLEELIKSSPYAPKYPKDQVNEDGTFKFEYHILDHDHLYDFNAWVFCCSIIENLEDIEIIKKRFNAKHHFFITDLDALIYKIQCALALNLQKMPFDSSGNPRIDYPENGKVFLDGHKNLVTYSSVPTKYTALTLDTLEEFYEKHARKISMSKMCTKSKSFEGDKEFRIIFFACENRGGNIYNTIDDHVILKIDLTDIISSEAIPLKSLKQTEVLY
jgi:hypothetical protein